MKFIISSVLISVLLFYSQNKMQHETLLNRSSLENIDNEIVEPVSDSSIEFKKELVFGTNNDVVVGEVTTVAIDRKGYVYIADGTQTRIHVFSKEGKYIKSLGRQGAGPGEFSGLTFNTSMTILSRNLFITDTKFYFPHRANVFSIDDLKFSYTIKLIPENLKDYKILKGYLPKQIVQENKGTLLVRFEQPPSLYKEGESFIYYVLINSDNNIVSKPILKLKNRKNITYLVEGKHPYLALHSFPFFEKSLFAISKEGIIYRAQSDEFKIHIYDSKGNYKSSFSHPFDNKVFRKNKTIENYEKTGYKSELGDGVAIKMLKNAEDLPKNWPALDDMFIDDENRIWVSTIVDNFEVYHWWVLEPSGEVLTKFEWPRDKPIQTVKNNKLYTIEKNPKTFEKEVVQYQILMNE